MLKAKCLKTLTTTSHTKMSTDSYAPLRRAFMGCHLKEIEAIEPCAALGSVRAKPRWLRVARVKRSLEDPLLLLDEARHRPIQRDGAQ